MADRVYDLCIFCRERSLMTGEHLWDDWMGSLVKQDYKTYNGRYRYIDGVEDPTHVTPYKGNPADIKSHCVCETCNTGWMSALTNSAKPVVKLLISGQTTRLGKREQVHLANWIAVKTTTAEFVHRSVVAISDEDRLYIFNHKSCPPGWRIWIGNFERGAWKTAYGHDVARFELFGLDNVPSNSFSTYNTQFTTYTFGKLFVLVLTSFDPSPVALWRFKPNTEQFVRPIWPLSGYSLQWPPAALDDGLADYFSSAFMEVTIEVALAGRSQDGKVDLIFGHKNNPSDPPAKPGAALSKG